MPSACSCSQGTHCTPFLEAMERDIAAMKTRLKTRKIGEPDGNACLCDARALCGPVAWEVLHSWASNIEREICPHCGEFAVKLATFAHDVVNAKLGKPLHDPELFEEMCGQVHQLAASQGYPPGSVIEQIAANIASMRQDPPEARPMPRRLQRMAMLQANPRDRVDWCNLAPSQIDAAWAWRPLRNSIVEAVGAGADVQMCGSELDQAAFMLSSDFGRVPGQMEAWRRRTNASLGRSGREVLEFGTKRVVFEVVLPASDLRPEDLLGGRPQEIFPDRPSRPPEGVQPSLFQRPDPWGSRCRDPETGQWISGPGCPGVPTDSFTTEGSELTWAMGPARLEIYELVYRAVESRDLIPSHDPFTFAPNPDFPQDLQPRLRERAAPRVQVERIAMDLDPRLLIEEFHSLDRGAPIIGPDLVVESGNGRIMSILRAAADFPESYQRYRVFLEEVAPRYGLDPGEIAGMDTPVLVRERLTDVVRTDFVEEANATSSISRSTVEVARTDADNVTIEMLEDLQVLEGEAIEDALRANRNRTVVTRFLATLPREEQAGLVDAQGVVNQDGIRRMGTAIFVRAFGTADAGFRLAERWYETTEPDIRNVFNGITRALGPLARAEALVADEQRGAGLSIAEDLAQVVSVYAAIKRQRMRVDEYLAQSALFDRELNDFQEGMLVAIDERRRSARRIGELLRAYADLVIASPPPQQVGLFGDAAGPTKEEVWANAMRMSERESEREGEGMGELFPAAQTALPPRRLRARQSGFGSAVVQGLASGLGFGAAALAINRLTNPSASSQPPENLSEISPATQTRIAETILQQLGGRQFIAMTGARDLVGLDRGLQFGIPTSNRINKVRILLNSRDLYDVEFFNIRRVNVVEIARQEDVPAESLRAVFTRHTGLDTRLSQGDHPPRARARPRPVGVPVPGRADRPVDNQR